MQAKHGLQQAPCAGASCTKMHIGDVQAQCLWGTTEGALSVQRTLCVQREWAVILLYGAIGWACRGCSLCMAWLVSLTGATFQGEDMDDSWTAQCVVLKPFRTKIRGRREQ